MTRCMNGLLTLLLTCLLMPLQAAPQATTPPAAVPGAKVVTRNDGPYVLWEGREARVLSVWEGQRQERRLRAPYDLDLPGLSTLRLDPAAPAPPPSDLALPERIAAVSDVHGNLEGLLGLLRAHGIIDAHRNWTFRRGHLVVVGDVFDRGPQVTETFWLLRHLEVQAQAAGGRVHVLLGNHEINALRGDERYLNPDYLRLQGGLLALDQKALYGPTSELGRWLRSRPVLLRLGPFLFVHGGISPEWVEEEKDLEAFNRAFRLAMDQEGAPRLLGRGAPIRYRGLLPASVTKRPEASAVEVQRVIDTLGVRTLVVGHTTLKAGITAFHGGRVHGIDADLQTPGRGELWLFQMGTTFRGRADGSSLSLVMASAAPLP